MTIHISLDLETWGTTPGSDIRSIGAVVFDPTTGHVDWHPPFYRATDNPSEPEMTPGYMLWNAKEQRAYKYALHRDPETVQWWNEQSKEAQAAFADPIDLRDALTAFGEWLDRTTYNARPIIDDRRQPLDKWDGLRIWSHGAAFDPPILAAAYDACGLPVPWHYRAPRDTRTAFDMAGIDDHSAWLAQHPGLLGVMHHALDDAICQARAICSAYHRSQMVNAGARTWLPI